MKKIINYISSRRFAIYLMLITTGVILLSNLLPNTSLMQPDEIAAFQQERPILFAVSDTLKLERLTRTWYFQLIPLFLFLSVSICTLKRFKKVLARKDAPSFPNEIPTKYLIETEAGDLTYNEIAALLKGRGWRLSVYSRDKAVITAKKGKNGIWGSFLFHLGMDVVMIGILISALTSFTGTLFLTEGFPVTLPDGLVNVSGSYSDLPISKIKLESCEVIYYENHLPK